MLSKEFLEHGIDVAVQLRWCGERLGARMRFESGVTDGQRERPRREPCFAQPFAGFLREVAEHRRHFVQIRRVFAERVIVRNGFRLRVNYEFVGIAATRLAVERLAPLAKNLFQSFL